MSQQCDCEDIVMIRERITGDNAQYYSTLAPSHKHSLAEVLKG